MYSIFHDVAKNWILDDRFIKINGLDYINDDDRLEKLLSNLLGYLGVHSMGTSEPSMDGLLRLET